MEFRSVYVNPPKRVGIDCSKGDKARQEFKEESDINRIMNRYQSTGVLPPGRGLARYGDFSMLGDFQSAQDLIVRARESFEALPALVRDRFRNSPEKFVEFVSDKSNMAEAVRLGIVSEDAVKRFNEANAPKPVEPPKEVK